MKSNDKAVEASAFQALQKGDEEYRAGACEKVEESLVDMKSSSEAESDKVVQDNGIPITTAQNTQKANPSQSREGLLNLTKDQLINLVIDLQKGQVNSSSPLAKSDANVQEEQKALSSREDELSFDEPRLAKLETQTELLETRCKNLRKELNLQKRRFKYSEENLRINEEIISLLALRLDGFELPPLIYGGTYSDNSNELKEISAALMEEVDRVHNSRIRQSHWESHNQERNNLDPVKKVKLNKDEIGDIPKMREEWGEERERRLFNLEGIVDVLFNRIEIVERNFKQSGKLAERDEEVKSVISQFDFGSTSEDDEEGSSDGSTAGGNDDAGNCSMKDRLDKLEKGFEDLNEKFEKLGS